jgi:NAD(P)-dependent dehydrogenase (short-subunit alcohol dehydrogenase family)
MAGWGVYCATKFAVEGLSEALADELRPLGIRVLIVEPGAFRTDFLHGTWRTGRAIEDYGVTAGLTRQWAETTNHVQRGDPAKAAEIIVAVASSPDAPLRLQLGGDCVERIENKLDQVGRDLSAIRGIAVSTDFDERDEVPRAPSHLGNRCA